MGVLVNADLSYQPDRTLAVTPEALRCAGCGTMHVCFVNRDGRTRCFACDRDFAARGLAQLQTSAKGSPPER